MFVVNLGGEGEVPGALNQQEAWFVLSSSVVNQQHFASLVGSGHNVLICPNDAVTLPDCCADVVHTNNVQLDVTTWRGLGGADIGNPPYPEERWCVDPQRANPMDKTLTNFVALLDPDPLLSPAEEQRRASAMLPDLVSRSPMRWLSGSDSPNGTGDKLVVGVAVWSRYDLTLLDELNHFAESNPNTRISVFDVDRIAGEFERFVPGIGEVLQTPVVGHWAGGTLTEKGTGHAGREIVRKVIATTHAPASST